MRKWDSKIQGQLLEMLLHKWKSMKMHYSIRNRRRRPSTT
jgi:hypothetical protein